MDFLQHLSYLVVGQLDVRHVGGEHLRSQSNSLQLLGSCLLDFAALGYAFVVFLYQGPVKVLEPNHRLVSFRGVAKAPRLGLGSFDELPCLVPVNQLIVSQCPGQVDFRKIGLEDFPSGCLHPFVDGLVLSLLVKAALHTHHIRVVFTGVGVGEHLIEILLPFLGEDVRDVPSLQGSVLGMGEPAGSHLSLGKFFHLVPEEPHHSYLLVVLGQLYQLDVIIYIHSEAFGIIIPQSSFSMEPVRCFRHFFRGDGCFGFFQPSNFLFKALHLPAALHKQAVSIHLFLVFLGPGKVCFRCLPFLGPFRIRLPLPQLPADFILVGALRIDDDFSQFLIPSHIKIVPVPLLHVQTGLVTLLQDEVFRLFKG